jgi:hypothetical protein
MKRQLTRKTFFCVCILMVVFAHLAWPQDQSNTPPQAGSGSGKAQPKVEEPEANTSAGTEALQKATQNPVASLISVPVQNNTNFGQNPGYRTQDVLNIQPVIPIGISKDWNLLLRWIAPIVWQPVPNAPGAPETGEYGLGDMVPTFFISPKKPGKLIWGVGPVLLLPTATNTFLGQGKLGIGPSVVVLTQPGHWTLGALVSNTWSVAGSGSRPDVNQFLLQYFIQLQLEEGLVHQLAAHAYSKLGSCWWQPMDGAVWWRSGKNHETRIPTCVAYRTVLCQCGSSHRNSVLDHAVANFVSVSQVDRGREKDAAGEKTETDGRAAAAEELNESNWIVESPTQFRLQASQM